MSTAPNYIPHYTVDDYEQWRGDWELWDGSPVALAPSPSVLHQRTAMQVLFAINNALAEHNDCQYELLYSIDWRVNNDTVYRPDMLVIRKPITTTWIETTPSLLAEVLSPGTERNDREYKRTRFAEYGVAYYLIVDPKTRQVETLRLVDGVYQPADPGILQLHEGCTLSLDTNAIWS